jgi:hypothetical protein
MEQRRLRLGDILDDYCPRERRVTNHVIVAMVEDEVKHTRCSTCDADHEYKQARLPVLRKKKEPAALDATAVPEALRPRRADVLDVPESLTPADVVATGEPAEPEPLTVQLVDEIPEPVEPRVVEDDGPVHRRLIRATLPRPEGQVPERKELDFTVRQPGGGGGGGGRGEVDGNRANAHRRRRGPREGGERSGEMRFGGGQPGAGFRGQGGNGNRSGPPQGQSGQGRGGRAGEDGRPGGEGRFRRRRGR